MASLRVLRAGPGTTVQDAGRCGWLRFGVTRSGPMDWIAHARANILAGNAPVAAAIEVGIGGIELEAEGGAVWLGCAGAPFAVARNATALPSAGRVRLGPGDRLTVKAAAQGCWFYVSPAGGIEAEPVLGSLATTLRTGIGPPPVAAGDTLSIGPGTERTELVCAAEPAAATPITLRVVPGPQDDYFSEATLASFFGETYRVSTQSDRMGYRLEGSPLRHAKGFNIVSDAIALGAIQVPGDGLPIILMADHQPTGGYPKLGFVIRADIGRLAQCRPGAELRFAPVSVLLARTELFAALERLRSTLDRAASADADLSSERLLSMNLISGVCAPLDRSA
jgi:5-oxoprolinase (ATP-hydrolysing) subunit C